MKKPEKMTRRPLQFCYHFQFKDGLVKDYNIALHPETLSLIPAALSDEAPQWVHLQFKQCRKCPLPPTGNANCPIAFNIMELVDSFKSVLSYHDCTVVCETAERTYLKKTSVMEGLLAIFGIIMATSDCPVMEFLKPMARFHLPFSTIEETTVRSSSFYLLAQYFKHKNEPKFKFDFKILENHYRNVQLVNEGLLLRITSISEKDADKNAIVALHSLSQFLSMEIDFCLSELEYIFSGRFAE